MAKDIPIPSIGPISGEINIAPMTTAVELAFNPIEAMKMEQPLTAHKSGTVTSLSADVGATVTPGTVICELKD